MASESLWPCSATTLADHPSEGSHRPSPGLPDPILYGVLPCKEKNGLMASPRFPEGWWRDDPKVDPSLYPIYEDFRQFLRLVWKHLSLPDPTPVQYNIASYLQHGPRRSMIEAYRGVGKSWITSAYVCWVLLRDPDHKFLVVSASKERADGFSVFTKRLISEMPMLKHLQPKHDQRSSNVAFDVGPAQAAHAPSVKSVGITGQITGSRANTIIPDDVEVPQNSDTVAKREKLAEQVKEFDAVLSPGGDIKYLGTPQTEDSIYNKLPDRGYDIRIWPARYPNEKQRKGYGEKLAPWVTKRLDDGRGKSGEPVDPKRFTDLDLFERELSYGRSGFALQFMLDTNLSDGERYPLKLRDLIVMDVNPKMAPMRVVWASAAEQVLNDLPGLGFNADRWHKPMFIDKEWTDYQGVVMAIDPAGRGGDELGYAISGMLNGIIYVMDCQGLTGGYSDENLERLAKLAKHYGVKHIRIEENFGDGMFTKLFTPWLLKVGYPCTTEEIKHNVQKEKRIIDTLEPVMNQHRLVIDKKLILRDESNYNDYAEEHAFKYRLFYQMTRITRDKGSLFKDDRLDVLAMNVAYWVETMDVDVRERAQEMKSQAMLDEIEKILMDEGLLGEGYRSGYNWTNT